MRWWHVSVDERLKAIFGVFITVKSDYNEREKSVWARLKIFVISRDRYIESLSLYKLSL